MTPLVMVGGPVRNRAWVLPQYLDALEAVNYPSDRTFYFWVVNDSTDDSERILRDWLARTNRHGAVTVKNYGDRPADTRGALRLGRERRATTYPILADLRQGIFDTAVLLDVDYYLSIDSDVIVPPNVLTALLGTGKDAVAGLIDNGHGSFNYLFYDELSDMYVRRRTEIRGLEPVGLTGAVCLYSRVALSHGVWSVGESGEDEGIARSLRSVGVQMWVDGRVTCTHVLEGPTWQSSN